MIVELSISKRDLLDTARILGGVFQTFTAQDYCRLLATQAPGLEEEQANDILLDLVAAGGLREVGPGVYSIVFEKCGATMEFPLWPEEARR